MSRLWSLQPHDESARITITMDFMLHRSTAATLSLDETLIRRAVSVLVIAGCALGVGCQDVMTTWSAEAVSPDGRWLATARSQHWGGPGTAYDATTVYLKPMKGSLPPTEVLSFSHQYTTMNLKMAWLTPTHLDVTYGPSANPEDQVSLDFQAIKYATVEISVRESSNEKTKVSQ